MIYLNSQLYFTKKFFLNQVLWLVFKLFLTIYGKVQLNSLTLLFLKLLFHIQFQDFSKNSLLKFNKLLYKRSFYFSKRIFWEVCSCSSAILSFCRLGSTTSKASYVSKQARIHNDKFPAGSDTLNTFSFLKSGFSLN